VTGSSSGIGEALSKRLLLEGATVIGLSPLWAPNKINHDMFHSIISDISQRDAVTSTFEEIIAQYGQIDLYVANAGQARYGLSSHLKEKDIDDLFNLNVHATMQGLMMMKQSHNNTPFIFVAISSVMAFWPLPGYAVYSATKAAVATFVKGFRHELSKGQHAQIVYPVATQTNFFKVSGQTHRSWMIQSPDHVARCIVNGIKRHRKNIHPSFIFRWTHKLMPLILNVYLRREKRLFESDDHDSKEKSAADADKD
jgi:uncharacterized protein